VPAHAFGQSFEEWREGILTVLTKRANRLKVETVHENKV
jgi:hypothetical protein